MKTIEELEKETIVGNAHNDQHIMDGCHKVLMSGYPMDEKIRAIELLDKVMGITEEGPVTESDVEEYISDMTE